MIDEKFVIIGAILSLIGSATYAWSTVKGNTKPNRVTWFLWGLAPSIAFVVQVNEGVGMQSLMTLAFGLGPWLVFIASFLNKQSYWKIKPLDIFCGILSLAAIMVWLTSDRANLAIIMSIAADFFAGLPTLIKAFNAPSTEHPDVYRNSAIGASITILTIDNWTFANYSFALFALVSAFVMYILVRFQLGVIWRRN